MAQEKDSVELIPILDKLYERLEGQVRVALIGGGPMREELEKEAKEREYICFPGFMRGDDLYAACKWTRHASLNFLLPHNRLADSS